jgi:hypothetical protein
MFAHDDLPNKQVVLLCKGKQSPFEITSRPVSQNDWTSRAKAFGRPFFITLINDKGP